MLIFINVFDNSIELGFLLGDFSSIPAGQSWRFIDKLVGLGPEAVANLPAERYREPVGQGAGPHVLFKPPESSRPANHFLLFILKKCFIFCSINFPILKLQNWSGLEHQGLLIKFWALVFSILIGNANFFNQSECFKRAWRKLTLPLFVYKIGSRRNAANTSPSELSPEVDLQCSASKSKTCTRQSIQNYPNIEPSVRLWRTKYS